MTVGKNALSAIPRNHLTIISNQSAERRGLESINKERTRHNAPKIPDTCANQGHAPERKHHYREHSSRPVFLAQHSKGRRAKNVWHIEYRQDYIVLISLETQILVKLATCFCIPEIAFIKSKFLTTLAIRFNKNVTGREIKTYALNRYMSARTGNSLRSNRLQRALSAAGSIIRAVSSVDPSSVKETDSKRFSTSSVLESSSAIVSNILSLH